MCWRDGLSNDAWWENHRRELQFRELLNQVNSQPEPKVQKKEKKEEKPEFVPTKEVPF